MIPSLPRLSSSGCTQTWGSDAAIEILPWYTWSMGSYIWIGIFIGSTIGGLIPEIWGGDMLSYSGVLLSGVGAVAGLWLGSRASR